jgi:aminoglycoside 3-N-acetyltransferase
MHADIVELFEFSRWSSFDKILGLAQRIAEKMRAVGLEDVRLIEFPADGRTAYGGWVMPRAYDALQARLALLAPGEPARVLADYRTNPTSLMLYSLPTPPEGITADLVVADALQDFTPDRLAGKLVLTSGIGVKYSRAAMRAGAVGLVSDCRNGHRWFKNGPEVDRTNEWHNYTIPPGDIANKGFGFSISPDQGRQLRARLDAGETLRLHTEVKTRHYDGVLPVISGRLPGLESEEVFLTGHYDEFGADDNCSQVAVALEAVRAIRALLEAGTIPPLRRSLRILFPMEVRGFNALIQNEAETRNLCVGLNIDTVGTDQNAVTSTCTLSDSFAALPSFADDLVAELLARIAAENPLFRWRRTHAEMIDNIFGEPLIGAPTPSLWHYSATHHLATDTPDRISGRMLMDMARLSATYVAFLANAGLPESLWLAALVAEQALHRFQEIAAASLRDAPGISQTAPLLQQLGSLHERYARNLVSPRRLVPDRHWIPCSEVVAERRTEWLDAAGLFPRESFDAHVTALKAQLDRAHAEVASRIRLRTEIANHPLEAGLEAEDESATSPSADTAAMSPTPNAQRLTPPYLSPTPNAQRPTPDLCVPVKAFKGFTAFEDLSDADQRTLHHELGVSPGWGAPMWLQNALMFANGKRTAAEIADLVRRHTGEGPEAERLERVFTFLAERGRVRLRPFLTQEAIRSALEKAGIVAGDLVLGHFALSRFGYIAGGAEALIDTMLSLLGPEGTLVMPTFTCSWIGRPPFDPQRTPSRVGAVTDRFWRRPGVLRSAHPTHSFAAFGPLAAELLAGHDHTRSPLSADSPISRIADLNGKILLFAPPGANTAMHVGEYRAGLPLLDFVCPIEEGGKRHEVLVPDCPWHSRFQAAYETLYARSLVRDTPLGADTLRTLRVADAIAAQAEVMRETPEALLQPGCDCLFCRKLQAHCRATGRIV